MTTTPRGIRNNNPGNIRNSERNDWAGEVSKADKKDNAFEEFKDIPHGVRAMMKLLLKYQRSYNLHSIKELIERWAPRDENDTAAYVRWGMPGDANAGLLPARPVGQGNDVRPSGCHVLHGEQRAYPYGRHRGRLGTDVRVVLFMRTPFWIANHGIWTL